MLRRSARPGWVDLRFWADDDQDVEQNDMKPLGSAVRALNAGDLEPFVGLITDEMIWKGQARGWLWWRHSPS